MAAAPACSPSMTLIQSGGSLAGLAPSSSPSSTPCCRGIGRKPIRSTSSAMRRRSVTPPPWRRCSASAHANAILVMNCPTALASSTDAAEAVIGAVARAQASTAGVPPILTNWLGVEAAGRGAGQVPRRRASPPSNRRNDAIEGFGYLWQYTQGARGADADAAARGRSFRHRPRRQRSRRCARRRRADARC